LPTDNELITTHEGDVILYSGNQIVLFYGSNSWNYTRLGRIEYQTLDELKTFLKAGDGPISVTLSIPETTGISTKQKRLEVSDDFVSLNGVRTAKPSQGIYIKNGKKYIK